MSTGSATRADANRRPAAGANGMPKRRQETTVAAEEAVVAESTASAPETGQRRLAPSEWIPRWALALSLVAFGAAAGWGVSLLLPTKYAAHAEILYSLTREQPTGFLREDRNITTQTVLIESRSVLDPVAEEWGISSQELADRVEAEVLSGSEVITIRLTDTDGDRAEEMLRWLVDSYLGVSNNDPRAELRDYLNVQLTEVLTRISEVRAVAELLADPQARGIVGPGASVLVPPYLETEPVSPKPLITTAAGAVTALVIAVPAVAVLARWLTRRQH